MWRRDNGTGRGFGHPYMVNHRNYANGVRRDERETRMRMIVLVIADRSFVCPIGANLPTIVIKVVTMLVAVVPDMLGMPLLLLQSIAYACRCGIGGIQREHDGKKKGKTGAHGGGL